MTPPRVFTISSTAMGRCPTRRMDVPHWRTDGTCECFPSKAEHAEAHEALDARLAELEDERERRKQSRGPYTRCEAAWRLHLKDAHRIDPPTFATFRDLRVAHDRDHEKMGWKP